MKQRIYLFFKTYCLFVLLAAVLKVVFMLCYPSIYEAFPLSQWLRVVGHGLILDFSIAGYLTALPGLLLLASVWLGARITRKVASAYFTLISVVLALIWISDIVLYGYWGFRLDTTPLFYLNSPKSALASAQTGQLIGGTIAILATIAGLIALFRYLILKGWKRLEPTRRKPLPAIVLFLLTALLFIPIRGGFTVSTMNVGKVYFSEKMELNHAAINPCFSFLDALTRDKAFDQQYRFFDEPQAAALFQELQETTPADSITPLFTVERPNIIFIVLESFMSKVVEPLGGIPNVATTLNRLCGEGVLFDHLYANSFRTDRGLVSIFSGYPAQPTTSIMKYPAKSQHLPSIPKSLKENGYDLSFFYGGDADFTNMRSYFVSMGIDRILSDKDFPLKDRMMKWGAHDEFVFRKLSDDLKTEQKEPFCKILLTLSSHEPFEVPFHRLDQEYLNSVAYTDSCLGVFIDEFKQSKYWDNTVIVLVPDHAMRYPYDISNASPERYQIPMLFVGGAIQEPRTVETIGSQIDLAATLLTQLGIERSEYIFSKDLLNPRSPHFAFYTFKDGFGFITPEGKAIFDCEADQPFDEYGATDNTHLDQGKALLQSLYNDLEKR